MTPLAHRIVKDMIEGRPIPGGKDMDYADIRSRMRDVHCFEITEALPLVLELAQQLHNHGVDARSTFLPAQTTWIEWRGREHFGDTLSDDELNNRQAWLIDLRPGEPKASLAAVAGDAALGIWFSKRMPDGFDFKWAHLEDFVCDEVREGYRKVAGRYWVPFILASLALINTPRVVARHEHGAHKGLKRAARSAPVDINVNGWTEILLDVAKLQEDGRRDGIEKRLTGSKALHFCRAHLRVKLGRLEIVRAHWRGDAANGIVQGNYRLAAAPGAAIRKTSAQPSLIGA